MVAETNVAIRKAVDELYVLSSSEEVRAEYERRQKALMDYNTHLEDHFLAGIKEGIKEGEVKGRKEGEIQGRREERSTIIGLLKAGYSLEELKEFLIQE